MAPPPDTGDLVRSLVRVPGSGSDKSAGSVCCDLARASSLAATVPVSPNLPAALTGSKPANPQTTAAATATEAEKLGGGNEGVKAEILKQNVPESGPPATVAPVQVSRKRSRPEEPEERVSPSTGSASEPCVAAQPISAENFLANKRPRVVYMTPQQVAQHANSIVQIPTASGPPILLLPLPQQVVNNAPSVLSSVDVANLLQERDILRQENQTLQHQLSLFQQLFRNRERLTSVVKRLGLKVE